MATLTSTHGLDGVAICVGDYIDVHDQYLTGRYKAVAILAMKGAGDYITLARAKGRTHNVQAAHVRKHAPVATAKAEAVWRGVPMGEVRRILRDAAKSSLSARDIVAQAGFPETEQVVAQTEEVLSALAFSGEVVRAAGGWTNRR